MTIYPAPAPPPRPKKAKKPVKKRNAKRHTREWLRAYGSVERVEFVKGLPCVACGRVGFAENTHCATGGMGRKAHFTMIAPLCGHLWSIVNNCHGELHRIGIKSFEEKYGVDLSSCSRETEKKWQEHKLGKVA